jgi:hypothetical protein
MDQAQYIQRYLNNYPLWMAEVMGAKVTPDQRTLAEGLVEQHFVSAKSGTTTGKAQPLSEPVLTPDGFRLMEAIKEGSYVIDADGLPTKVLGVYPQGEQEIY